MRPVGAELFHAHQQTDGQDEEIFGVFLTVHLSI